MTSTRPSIRRFSASPSVAEATPPGGAPTQAQRDREAQRDQLLDVLHRLDAVLARIDGALDGLSRLDSARTHRQGELG